MGTSPISAGYTGFPPQTGVNTGKADDAELPQSNAQAQESTEDTGSAAPSNAGRYPPAEPNVLCQVQVRRYETPEGGGAHVFTKSGYIGDTPPNPGEPRPDAASPGCDSRNGKVVPPQSNPTPVKREAGNESAADDDPWQQQAAPRQEAQQQPLSEDVCKLPVGKEISGQTYLKCKINDIREGGDGFGIRPRVEVTAFKQKLPDGQTNSLGFGFGEECADNELQIGATKVVKGVGSESPLVDVGTVFVQVGCVQPKQFVNRAAAEYTNIFMQNFEGAKTAGSLQNRRDEQINAAEK